MKPLALVAVCATAALLALPVGAHAVCGDAIVDAGEECDDGSAPNSCCTDACTFEAAHVMCRPSADPCDVPEFCSGTSGECSPDNAVTDDDGDGVCDVLDICPFFPDPRQDNPQICVPQPLKRLDSEALASFSHGRELFVTIASIATGLGPVFNGRDCFECHNHPMSGGASDRFVTRFGRYESGTFDPMTSFGGSLIQANGIDDGTCSVVGETVPAEATVSARRISPPVLGAGLMEAIPDATLLALADPADTDGDGISGRPNMVGGAIGRFGWKAQVATVREFAGLALRDEIGITSPDFPDESSPQGGPVVCDSVADPEDVFGLEVDAVTDFMTFSASLKRTHVKGASRGRGLFRKIGCESCHVSELRTGDNPVRALYRQRVRLFSDLLLHDMGATLADGIEQGEASGSEFRTPPLWGVGRRSVFLHDGRAATLLDAVLEHGGEAQAVHDAFAALDPADRAAIITFLSSL